jgi:glutaredoxin
MILDSKSIEYVVVDITEPGKENEKEFMQQNSNAKEAKHPLPPQIFNEDNYCGVSLILVIAFSSIKCLYMIENVFISVHCFKEHN